MSKAAFRMKLKFLTLPQWTPKRIHDSRNLILQSLGCTSCAIYSSANFLALFKLQRSSTMIVRHAYQFEVSPCHPCNEELVVVYIFSLRHIPKKV
jgi:hypothetical protein